MSEFDPQSATRLTPGENLAAQNYRHLREEHSDPLEEYKRASREIPEPGDFFLNFHIESVLGQGSFGRVFLARQTDLAGRPVVLKIAPHLGEEPDHLAQLQHTNIMPIYSAHRSGPLQAICMPYLGTATLANMVHSLSDRAGLPVSGQEVISTLNSRPPRGSTAHPLDDDAVAPWGGPVDTEGGPEMLAKLAKVSYVEAVLLLGARLADGLAHAHERGLVHRDLKPANVLLARDGQPVILDFNLAESVRPIDLFEAARVGGTVPYMAPEQLLAFAGKPAKLDHRADLFSLGLMLYELLAGRHAFPEPEGMPQSSRLWSIMAMHGEGAPPLRPLNPEVSPATEAIILKCLKTDPDGRYAHARELREDLERQFNHQPLRFTREPSRKEALRKWCRRHPRLTSNVTVGGVAAALLLGVTLWGYRLSADAAQHRAEAGLRALKADAADWELRLNNTLLKPDERDRLNRTAAERLDAVYPVLSRPDDWREADSFADLVESGRDRAEREVAAVLAMLARSEAARGRGREAMRYADAAAAVRPEELPYGLARLRGELRGEPAGKAEADPATARGWALKATGHLRRAEPAAAERSAEKAVALKTDYALAWFLLGNARLNLGNFAAAEAAFATCLAVKPGSLWARYNRGYSRFKKADHVGAEADFTDVLKGRPGYVHALVNRALARRGLKRYQDALADLDAAVTAGASPVWIGYQQAGLLDRLGEKDKAAAKRRALAGRTPRDPRGWLSRGLDRLPHEPEAALADFNAALELNPSYAEAWKSKIHVLAEELDRTAEAIEALDRLLQLRPEDVYSYAGRAVLHARLGDRAKALADAERVLRMTRGAKWLYMVGSVYAQTSKQREADRDEAFRLLKLALARGFGWGHLKTDPDLDPIRGDGRFARLLASRDDILD